MQQIPSSGRSGRHGAPTLGLFDPGSRPPDGTSRSPGRPATPAIPNPSGLFLPRGHYLVSALTEGQFREARAAGEGDGYERVGDVYVRITPDGGRSC